METLDIQAKINSLSKEQVKDLSSLFSKTLAKLVVKQLTKLSINRYNNKRCFGRAKKKISFAIDNKGSRIRFRWTDLNDPNKSFYFNVE